MYVPRWESIHLICIMRRRSRCNILNGCCIWVRVGFHHVIKGYSTHQHFPKLHKVRRWQTLCENITDLMLRPHLNQRNLTVLASLTHAMILRSDMFRTRLMHSLRSPPANPAVKGAWGRPRSPLWGDPQIEYRDHQRSMPPFVPKTHLQRSVGLLIPRSGRQNSCVMEPPALPCERLQNAPSYPTLTAARQQQMASRSRMP